MRNGPPRMALAVGRAPASRFAEIIGVPTEHGDDPCALCPRRIAELFAERAASGGRGSDAGGDWADTSFAGV